ncbi:VOC family protein [Stappia sp.]|uniref:VOC family protein n=1 Tax=Stappia sp. TaxID=1870903 RepID=UPI0032D8FA11
MLKEIGALWVDHVAVTTGSFEETSRHFLAMPGARTLRGPGWNNSQKVHFLFVTFGGDLCIEVLGLPENGDSPIAAHVDGGGGAYHLCYAVADLDMSLKAARSVGARVIVEPRADDAYDGRRVAFLMHPAHGLFELVEAYGSFAPRTSLPELPAATAPAKPSVNDDLAADLESAFRKIFTKGLPEARDSWRIGEVETWDSLGHMRLVMEVERRFDVSIPSANLSRLRSFDDFLSFLSQQD